MVGITFRFVGGRYHATPWDRHVNEASVAWPPEPWRILRALVALWHGKGDQDRFPEPVLESLLETLASSLPTYRLPKATHSHTQHYMPPYKGNKILVFDGFLSVDPEDPLKVWWPEASLGEDESTLLDHLLARFSYLGRAESWVEADRLDVVPDSTRALAVPLPPGTDSVDGEVVDVLAPRPPAEYRGWRESFLAETLDMVASSKRSRNKITETLPPRFVDLLRLETSMVQDAGWSRFPGTRFVRYRLPPDWDRIERARRPTGLPARGVTTARLALVGRPLPRIEDAIKIGEVVRMAALKSAERVLGDQPIPWTITGHRDDDDDLEHRHAFYLPEDADGDGWIDHVIVHAEAGIGDAVLAIAALEAIWLPGSKPASLEHPKGGKAWRVYFEGSGERQDFAAASSLLGPARRWRSATPYLHPWFAKGGFGPREQLEREIGLRRTGEALKLASPPERLDSIDVHGTRRLTTHFHRFRDRRPGMPRLTQPDRQGSFWSLEFEEEVTGPLAFGFAAHFGLGLFVPDTT